MTDKPRGFLTDADREYLEGEKELSEGSEFNTRRRILKRAEQGFEDFALLFDQLSQTDRKKLFGIEGVSVRTDPALEADIRDTLAFIFRGLLVVRHMMIGSPPQTELDEVLSEAVRRVGEKEGYVVSDVSFEVEADRVNLDAALEKAKEGEKLSSAEMGALVNEGRAELKLLE